MNFVKKHSLHTGFNVWQNQTQWTSKGGRIMGGVEDEWETVRSEIKGIQNSWYLRERKLVKRENEMRREEMGEIGEIERVDLRMEWRRVGGWWSQWESATVLRNSIFLRAADTRSTPKRIAAISGMSLRLLVEIWDSDITERRKWDEWECDLMNERWRRGVDKEHWMSGIWEALKTWALVGTKGNK